MPLDELTEREHDVLHLLSAGLTNQQIADEMIVAVGTVKAHCHSIYSKLGVANRTQAILRAQELLILTSEAEADATPVAVAEAEADDAPRIDLPIFNTPFIGREEDLQQLEALVTNPRSRLVTVTGSGGMGKTRLAVACATRVASHFAEGVYFLPLATAKSWDEAVSIIGDAVGIVTQQAADPLSELIDGLAGRRVLLVLDNCEHLLDDLTLFNKLLNGTPSLMLLATSRERFYLSMEVVYVLGGMPYETGDVRVAAAGELFLYQASAVVTDFKLSPGDTEHLARICQMTQGMPLALLIAASWLDVLSIGELADEIAASFDILETEMRDFPERQRSIRTIFDYSWKRLTSREQRAFASLTVLRGRFSRRAAEAITGINLRVLQMLVNRSFIISRDGHYEIHELLRQYGHEQLARFTNATLLYDAHANYFMAGIGALEVDIKGAAQVSAIKTITQELPNIRQAWRWALSRGRFDLVDRALETFAIYLYIQSRLYEGKQILQDTLNALDDTPDHQRLMGRLLNRLSLLQSVGRSLESWEPAERSLTIAEAHNDNRERGVSLEAMGNCVLFVTQDYAKAATYYTQALEIQTKLNETFYMARCYHKLGFTHAFQGHMDALRDYTEEARKVAAANGNLFNLGHALGNLGGADFLTGKYASAKALLIEAADVLNQLERSEGYSSVVISIGEVCWVLSELDEAIERALAGLRIARHIRDSGLQAHGHSVLSLSYSVQGKTAEAYRLATLGLVTRNEDHPRNVTTPLAVLLASIGLGEVLDSLAYLRLAYDEARQLETEAGLAWLLPPLAVIYAEEGHDERAVGAIALAKTHPLSGPGWFEHWQPFVRTHEKLRARIDAARYEEIWKDNESRALRPFYEVFWATHQQG